MATILVADDEQDMRAVLVKLLSKAGHTVIQAEDGRAALEMAISQQPDVIILDVSMPAMGGPEVLEKLRELPATQTIPIIFLSAYPDSQVGPHPKDTEADDFGSTAYITKPWKRGAIERAIRRAVLKTSGN